MAILRCWIAGFGSELQIPVFISVSVVQRHHRCNAAGEVLHVVACRIVIADTALQHPRSRCRQKVASAADHLLHILWREDLYAPYAIHKLPGKNMGSNDDHAEWKFRPDKYVYAKGSSACIYCHGSSPTRRISFSRSTNTSCQPDLTGSSNWPSRPNNRSSSLRNS